MHLEYGFPTQPMIPVEVSPGFKFRKQSRFATGLSPSLTFVIVCLYCPSNKYYTLDAVGVLAADPHARQLIHLSKDVDRRQMKTSYFFVDC